MAEAVKTYEGWFSLHSVYKIDFQQWHSWSSSGKAKALAELKEFLSKLEAEQEAHQSGYAFYQTAGHKGDLLLWLLQPTLNDITTLENAFSRLKIAAVLTRTYSFVSVIEVSNYLNQSMDHPSVQAKLYPQIPKKEYICFYPMSKRRNLTDNWYMLDYEERANLMRTHGKTGRKYEGLLLEYTTGAFGLDDYEWGITLMGDDPVQFKKIVCEMRFDEVSARFGIFGSFYVGHLITEEVLDSLFV